MLVIVRNRTKKRITLGIQVLITLFILSLIISHLYGIYHGHNIIREGWLRDDRPSGNPMRVEKTQETVKKSDSGVLDRFEVKLKDFYKKDR